MLSRIIARADALRTGGSSCPRSSELTQEDREHRALEQVGGLHKTSNLPMWHCPDVPLWRFVTIEQRTSHNPFSEEDQACANEDVGYRQESERPAKKMTLRWIRREGAVARDKGSYGARRPRKDAGSGWLAVGWEA